jgi:RHS repeat-associated protein
VQGSFNVTATIPGNPNQVASLSDAFSIPAQTQALTYDWSGNLTNDGVWSYSYDVENRLVEMTNLQSGLNLIFDYDYLGRRFAKVVTAGTTVTTHLFIYAGEELIAETNSTGSITRSYTWGTAGPSALLELTNFNYTGANLTGTTDYLAGTDGNQNVSVLTNAVDTTLLAGSVAAAYEYGPFGEPLRKQAADPAVADNPFRFATNYTDVETGLVDFGRRYYNPTWGRFINRDPAEEAGGSNLYGYCDNDAINCVDALGMAPIISHNFFGKDSLIGDIWGATVSYGDGSNGPAGGGGYGSGGSILSGIQDPSDPNVFVITFGGGFGDGIFGGKSFGGGGQKSGAYNVTYNTKTGTTFGSVNGQDVAYTLASGASAVLDQISGQWITYDTMGGAASAVGPNNTPAPKDEPLVGQASVGVPADATQVSSSDYPFIGQNNGASCGPTAAWNALIYEEGSAAITQNNQVLYDKFSAQAEQSNGQNNTQIAAEFNAFAAGTNYSATEVGGNDPYQLATTATAGNAPFIAGTNLNGFNHAVVYVPHGGDQATVYSSTLGVDLGSAGSSSSGVLTWTASSTDIGAGIYRTSTTSNYYSVVQIGYKK